MSLSREQDEYIEQLYRELFCIMSVYAQSALRDKELAEEAVQDAFRIACAKPEELMSSPNPQGWMLNTLKYVIRNIRRNLARLNSVVLASISYETLSFSTPLCDQISEADLMYRDLIRQEDYDMLKKIVLYNYSMQETAEELGISVEACKKRVQRARQKLAEALKKIEKDVP